MGGGDDASISLGHARMCRWNDMRIMEMCGCQLCIGKCVEAVVGLFMAILFVYVYVL